MIPFYVIIGIIVAAALWLVAIYNGLVTLKNRVDEAESDIDVQLKRRHDLIPNLIETVKGYATHEREVFENVTKARNMAINAQTIQDKAVQENMLTETLKSLFAVAEAYPDLKANQNFLALQEELSDTENKIQASRRFYNGNVRDFNIKIEVFPNNMVAPVFGFKRREMFEIEEPVEREVPKVDFSRPSGP